MKHYLKFILIFLTSFSSLQVRAQLADEEKDFLASRVKDNYEVFGISGAQVYRTQKHWALVCIVSSAKLENIKFKDRLAQIEASRLAQEFLSGATNHQSTSILMLTLKKEVGRWTKKQRCPTKSFNHQEVTLVQLGCNMSFQR